MIVFDDIKQGLYEAIEYEKDRLKAKTLIDRTGGSEMNKRDRNIQIFEESRWLWESNDRLQKRMVKSFRDHKLVKESDNLAFTLPRAGKLATVIVSKKRTLEAAEPYVREGKKTCVLNFASATNPGGGVTRGSSAQEECICRCSTLYPCLNIGDLWHRFYKAHRYAGNPLYNDDCIYTPDVCVFREDTDFPELLPEEKWWDVNVITCAAPNLRKNPSNAMNPNAGTKVAKINNKELEDLLTSRIRRIFTLAAMEGNEVLILGAFGCGAFQNPPEIVAKAFRKVMEEYQFAFETIEYAVYCTPRDIQNYEVFRRVLSGVYMKES